MRSKIQERVFKEATAQIKLWLLKVNTLYVIHSDVLTSNSKKYCCFPKISQRTEDIHDSRIITLIMRASLFLPSPNIIWTSHSMSIRWQERVSRVREQINTYGILVGKSEREITLVNLGSRWKNDTKNEIRCEGCTILICLRVGISSLLF